jgi:hypothetical protein
MHYCPTCREGFVGDAPPYGVIHTMTQPPVHLHSETREVLVSLEDLTEAWHTGAWPGEGLEAVIRDHTGWNARQYGQWVSRGTVSTPA